METRFVMMPARQSWNFIVLLMLMQMILAMLLGGADAIKEWKTLSEEENLEMEAQLKVINKPPIKTFRTEDGDILDCIDIYKQRAFDHPLLKDHKIQMRPKRIPSEMMGGKSLMKTKPLRFLPEDIRCPSGSVLIKRTTKEDLIMAHERKALGLNYYPTSSRLRRPNDDDILVMTAIQYAHQSYGAKATMNVWNPSVSSTQISDASIVVGNRVYSDNVECIQAGWAVDPGDFKSNQPRLFTYWEAKPHGLHCVNYDCPGFVQVSKEISLGIVLQSSIYNGTQQDIEIGILKDGDWWLKFNNRVVGYWPKELFSYLKYGSNMVFWGGQVYSPPNEPFPAMGSGHLPEDGTEKKSAYFMQMQLWDGVNVVYPDENSLNFYTDKPQCYHYLKLYDPIAPNPLQFYYGGPRSMSTIS